MTLDQHGWIHLPSIAPNGFDLFKAVDGLHQLKFNLQFAYLVAREEANSGRFELSSEASGDQESDHQ